MIDHIFKPLFDVTMEPQRDENLFKFLLTVTGFDTVDDESVFENFFFDDLQTPPDKWT